LYTADRGDDDDDDDVYLNKLQQELTCYNLFHLQYNY